MGVFNKHLRFPTTEMSNLKVDQGHASLEMYLSVVRFFYCASTIKTKFVKFKIKSKCANKIGTKNLKMCKLLSVVL